MIYVWADGNWIYDWETTSFTMEHHATLEGGRWLNIDNPWGYSDLTPQEVTAMSEALGE